jgi:carbon-monoxide dehydrogenase medium subunit
MDLPPVLSALGAEVTIAGPAGERTVPVASLATGYYETAVRRDELITALTVPPPGRKRAAYLKCTVRSADDWPALGVAVALELDGTVIRDAVVVVSAATDKPTRLAEAEGVLRGGAIDDATLARAGEAAVAGLDIVGDAHGSGSYKRELLRVYLARAVRAAAKGTA